MSMIDQHDLRSWPDPPDYTKVLYKRALLLDHLRRNPKVLTAYHKHYASNPWDFIEDWGITYDPRAASDMDRSAYMPIVLFPRQKEFLHWLWDRLQNKEDGLAEKSRDVGATVLAGGFAATLFLYMPGFSAGFGSVKVEKVDKLGDPDSILEKIRIFLRFIPSIFLPTGWSERQHATHCKIVNPKNGNTIVGEGGDQIGRGGRKSMFVKDESAHYLRPEAIESAISENSDVKIDLSSVNGPGNVFHRKRESFPDHRIFIFDWRDDPRKTQEWYDKKTAEAKEAGLAHIVAQEIDRDYHAAVSGTMIPAEWIRAAIDLDIPDHGEIVAALDVADQEGEDANALAIRKGVKLRGLVETWNGMDTDLTTKRAYNRCVLENVGEFRYDSLGVGAGVRGGMGGIHRNKQMLAGEGKTGKLPFKVVPFDAGGNGPNNPKKEIFEGKKNEDLFGSPTGQAWWLLRMRFYKAYRFVTEGVQYPIDEMISIPNDPKLIAELSTPLLAYDGAGRILRESKAHMKVRGFASTNRADAVAILYTEMKLPRERRLA